MWLRQSTGSVINFGPVVSKTDGVTLQVGILASLDHATTGVMLSKNGGTLAVREQGANFVATTYDAHGCYKVSLSAIDTNTLGRLRVIHTEPATYLAVWQDFMIVPQQVWDSMFGSDKLDVAVVEQANIDFGALQKSSLNAATPASVQNIPATGSGFTAIPDMALNSTVGKEATLVTIAGYIDTEIGTIATAVGTTIPNAIAALPTDADVNAACDTAISDAALATAVNLATVDTVVDAIKVKTDTLGGAGSISYPFIVTQTGGAAVDGAQVWVSTDSQGVNIIANGITDVNGLYTFHLDAGTYTFWAQHSGLNPASVQEVVS
jgi:hypothetical protein